MKFALVDDSPIQKTLSVEEPEEVVSKEIAHAYSHLVKTVRLPGFRKGKVPKNVLEKKYEDEIKSDVIQRLVPDYYQKAVKESGIDPVEYPRIENVEIIKNAPLSSKATVEVRPKFDLKGYTGLALKLQKHEVTDENVDRSIESLRNMHGMLEPVSDDHAVGEKDHVIIDFEAFIGAEPMEGGKAEGYPIEIGAKALIPGFEENLTGKRKGEMAEFTVTLPADIKPEKNAGKEARFKVAIKDIKKKVLPEINEDFAKDFGMDSVPQLREKLKEELVGRFNRERDAVLKNEVIKSLNLLHEFELPPSLVTRELVRIIRGLRDEDLKQEGLKDIGEIKNRFEPLARERVKGSLILYMISRKENISVTPQEVEKEIRKIAHEAHVPFEEAKKNIQDAEGPLGVIESRLLESRTLDFLVSTAVIEES